jgi:hypothetical protein
MAQHVGYPAVEFPVYKYTNDSYKIINVPSLKDIPMSAPRVSEMQFADRRNTAIIKSLQLYKYENQRVLASSSRTKLSDDNFERRREQANAILFQTFYCSTLFAATVLWLLKK